MPLNAPGGAKSETPDSAAEGRGGLAWAGGLWSGRLRAAQV